MSRYFTQTMFTPHSVVPSHLYRKYRPTISVVLVGSRDQVAFVQSAMDPSGRTWILPQGGIHGGETFEEAARREIAEELGMEIYGDPIMLGEYVNELPPDRGVHKSKLMYCVGVRTSDMSAVLNHENTKVGWQSNQHAFWALMGNMFDYRPLKFRGMCHALIEAHRHGLISWSCEELLDYVPQAA